MNGTILRNRDGLYDIITTSHFLEQPGTAMLRTFSATLTLSQEEFANTRDMHTITLLYAIASEALRIGASHDKVAQMIGYGEDVIADLERRGGVPETDIQPLKNSWLALKNAFRNVPTSDYCILSYALCFRYRMRVAPSLCEYWFPFLQVTNP